MVKYKPNDKPTVKNVTYIKNKRTFTALIPSLSASLENTPKPFLSKK